MRMFGINETAKAIGWSPYAVRMAVYAGRLPHVRTTARGKIFLDLDLVEATLRGEAMSNVRTEQESTRGVLRVVKEQKGVYYAN